MILTLGHSTHSADDFIAICRAADIRVIADVRSHPGSKRSPQYDRAAMAEWLPAAGIGYEWWPQLGGWDVRHQALREWAQPRGTDLDPYLRGHFPKQRIALTCGTDYEHVHDDLDPQYRTRWGSVGLHDYANFMLTPEFQAGLLAFRHRHSRSDSHVAMICCEAHWWRCHRSLIADLMAATGTPVWNAMPHHTKSAGWQPGLRPHDAAPRLNRYSPEWQEQFRVTPGATASL